jgi:hypothetical protein
MADAARYIASALTAQKTPLPTVIPLLSVTQLLPSNGTFTVSTDLGLSNYATICLRTALDLCMSLPKQKSGPINCVQILPIFVYFRHIAIWYISVFFQF